VVRFEDRRDAGRRLADALRKEVDPNVLVLGLARGGIPVAYEVARGLEAPLDVLVVRKLGVPGNEELALGAVGPGGAQVINDEIVRALRIPQGVIEMIAAQEQEEVEGRERSYRDRRPREDVRGRHVVIVDDGLATGASMRAAIASVRASGAARITVAVPTGSAHSCDELRIGVDEVLCLIAPEEFFAISMAYEDFSQTSDREIRDLLAEAARQRQAALGIAHP
jgi:predicted phosphoribosyltransferase